MPTLKRLAAYYYEKCKGLGFTGKGEGISAQSICLLTTPRNYKEDILICIYLTQLL